MKRPRDLHRTEPEANSSSPWLEAAVRAKDPNTFLMSLGETEFAVLLAELEARRRAGIATAGAEAGRQPVPRVTAPAGHGDDTARYRRLTLG